MAPDAARGRRGRWLAIGCGAFVALVLICAALGALVNGNTATPPAAAAPTSQSNADRILAAAATPQVADASTPTAMPTVAPTDTPAPTDVPPTATPLPAPTPMPAIGQDVKVGDVRWKVLEAKDAGDTLTSDNSFIKPKTTAGKWIMLHFEVENQSTEQRSLTGVDLKDGQGRTFKPSNDALFFIPQEEQCTFAQLSANVPKTCRVYFEVPKDATGLRAVVGDLKLFGAKDQEIGLGL